MDRGYYGIGIYNTKTAYNVGTLWRSAMIFGAAFMFTIGKRYKKQVSDTINAIKHIPLFDYDDFSHFTKSRPYDCMLVGVEQSDSSTDIVEFTHPERAIYLLGAEDGGLPAEVMKKCQSIVHINTPMCLNVAVAGSIVMHERKKTNNTK